MSTIQISMAATVQLWRELFEMIMHTASQVLPCLSFHAVFGMIIGLDKCCDKHTTLTISYNASLSYSSYIIHWLTTGMSLLLATSSVAKEHPHPIITTTDSLEVMLILKSSRALVLLHCIRLIQWVQILNLFMTCCQDCIIWLKLLWVLILIIIAATATLNLATYCNISS